MLFNSFEFIVAFMPVCLIVYYALVRRTQASVAGVSVARLAIVWLIVCSLFFYAYWRPQFLLVLIASIAVNYSIGQRLLTCTQRADRISMAWVWLTLGIVFNLALLGWFKYAGLLVTSLNQIGDLSLSVPQVALPLAISFFTFQQIAWLVDCRRSLVQPGGFRDYLLFVSFFPQLISGPIVHHREMMPQFQQVLAPRPDHCISVGLTLFIFGLFKKTVIADGIGQYASAVFNGPAAELSFADAWGGAIAYGIQLYFDFSGYSDMAVGLAFMFGIRLPLNFYSPYQATNIAEFWRRWHMTLSRFLRDYLYIPLGGNRKGRTRRYLNLALTMILGGLWHGAGWQFALWGALHGLFLAVYHGYAGWRDKREEAHPTTSPRAWRKFGAIALTFTVVTLAWVPFRADSIDAALMMYLAMVSPFEPASVGPFASSRGTVTLIVICMCALLAPNTSQILGQFDPAIKAVGHTRSSVLQWSPNLLWSLVTLVLLIIALYRMMTTGYVEFLYRFF